MIIEKKIFTEDECTRIIKLVKKNSQNWDFDDRRYKSMLITHDEDSEWVFGRLTEFFEEATNYKIIELKKELHFHKYDENDWFGKHNDTRDRRLFSVGVLLNSDFEGGDFKIYTPQEVILGKNVGNTYIFNVTYEHEITKITQGIRYSLIWFIQDNNIKMKPISII